MSGRTVMSALGAALWAGVLLADATGITGYTKTFVSATDVGGSYRQTGLWDEDYLFDVVERLRLRSQVEPNGTLALGAHYEARVQWGDSVDLRRRLKEAGLEEGAWGGAPARPRFLELEGEIGEGDSVVMTHGFDRLWARIEPDPDLQLTIGRQAVSWGTGLIWSPTDLFAAFSPTEIDREEKVGVDVVRCLLQVSPNLSLDVVGEPLDLEEHGSVSEDDSSVAARLGTHGGEYDFHLCGGVIQSDYVLGGDFAGNLGDAGVRGEALQTWVDESSQRDYFRGLLGVDYAFAAPWNPYVAVEYYYNGLGESDPDDYAARRSESSVRRVIDRGIAYNIGRDYVGAVVRVQPGTLLTLQATTLANLHDGSFRELATLGWSMTQNSELVLGADIGLGGSRGEFTGWDDAGSGAVMELPDLYFLYGKYYF